MSNVSTSTEIEVIGKIPEFQVVLTPAAQQFLLELERKFRDTRSALLKQRLDTQRQIDSGTLPEFLSQTHHIREDLEWRVGAVPQDLQNRRVEITGPTDRKMMINALNSGANVFMADFEDANSPTWQNLLQGHINLRDAIAGTISFESPEGKKYRLKEEVAVLMVRPRGWHLPEKHFLVDGTPMSGSLFDAGLYFFHCARRLLEKGTAPYFYLPKLENHLEARLWNDVFLFMQEKLDIPKGTIKATVLIETILAALQMEEILYELREHIVGLNAGRWDYIFSIIKKFRKNPDVLFPDRAQITITVPFMRAYTELMVRTCHKRAAHAIGGMAAFIPNRKDAAVTETALAKVREDKERECGDGFDGTWVAHPDLVSTAREPFDQMLGDKPHQKERMREDVAVTTEQLLDFHVPGGCITEVGLRNNIGVGVQYLDAWLRGSGAVAIHNLMEDAATAEISRSQLWQWVHHPKAILDDGRRITVELYLSILAQDPKANSLAAQVLDRLIMDPEFADFLTLPAYEHLD